MKTWGSSENFINFYCYQDKRQNSKSGLPLPSRKYPKPAIPGEVIAKKFGVDISCKDFRIGISHTQLSGSFFNFYSDNNQSANKPVDLQLPEKIPSRIDKTKNDCLKAIQLPGNENNSIQSLGSKAGAFKKLVPSISKPPAAPVNKSAGSPCHPILLLAFSNNRLITPSSLKPSIKVIQAYQAMQNLPVQQPKGFQISV